MFWITSWLKVKDLNSSKRFYSAALARWFSVQYDADGIVVFGPKRRAGLGVWPKGETGPAVHIAFTAKDRASVKASMRLAAPRAARITASRASGSVSANYYGGFVKDPDGNNMRPVLPQGRIAALWTP